MKPLFDLHTHSTKSDGKLKPSALVECAAHKNIQALALTDHDTIDGLEEAADAAEKVHIHLVRGVEIEINWQDFSRNINLEDDVRREFHLLGLGIDTPSENFKLLMQNMLDWRRERNLLMAEKLRLLNLPCSLDDVYKISGSSFIGRPHFAEYLLNKKVVRTYEEAFKKYLAKGSPAFVPKKGAPFESALRAIKESGGIAVMAHPSTLFISRASIRNVLDKLKDSGLDGVECYHPLFSEADSRHFAAFAKELNLCVTAGSDFHGEGRRDRKLGASTCGTQITAALFDFSPLADKIELLGDSIAKFIMKVNKETM